MTDHEPVVYTVEETSVLLRKGLNQTYEAIRKGEIPSIRLGGRRILVPRQRLLDMINGGGDVDATG
jgi:excisionase family DNA binding protein